MVTYFNKFTLSSAGILLTLFCQYTMPVSGETEVQVKSLNQPSQNYLSQPSNLGVGYIWPTYGIVTSGFGQRLSGKIHTGIDIAGPIGTPIFAAASGVVVFAGWSTEGYGNLVTLKHPDGSLTLYGHNEHILVNVGQPVQQGQQISAMGNTGNSSGPHLHFEIRPQGKEAANPRAFLPTFQPPISSSNIH
ncbi:M23 family metallopeptidase [Gloeothece verrucosa]|uniref:Peptidase M23 n=1 Tax=Gloeothece verrucosa (strain PCC 7822) TaxID=497965 RepID=E0UL48_GLOV7|nr:M23 family metallopeptidase [Gloeothece verrucosa]ADN17678.1 Peptidase M23 [Gloeothece verrucosa PCC 7822]